MSQMAMRKRVLHGLQREREAIKARSAFLCPPCEPEAQPGGATLPPLSAADVAEKVAAMSVAAGVGHPPHPHTHPPR